MTLRPGEVVLIRIAYPQTPGGKLRPAVVLLGAGDAEFVAAPITSQARTSPFDLPMRQWRLGELVAAGREALAEVLRRAFSMG